MSDIHDMHPNEELLQAFLDGAVPSRERRRIEEHVASCASCTEELASWRLLFTDLDGLRSHRPSSDFEARVMAGVRVPEEVPWAARLKDHLVGLMPQGRSQHLTAGVLQELADGTLTTRQAARARTHVEGCPTCDAELRSWSAVMDRLTEVEHLAPSRGFAERVMVGFQAASSRQTATGATPVAAQPAAWRRLLAGAKRFVPRTRRAWAAISGAAVTPAVTFGLVLWAVFSHPTLTPQALASFVFWQLGDLAVAGWSALVTGGLEAARVTGLDAVLAVMTDAPLLTTIAFLSYAVAFVAAVRVLYKNLIDSRSLRHRYASASAS